MWHEERRARNSDRALTICGWTSPRFWWMRLRGRVMDLPRLARGTAWTPLSAAERRTRMLARRVKKERASCMIGTGLRCNLTEESERKERTRTRPWRTRGRRRGWRLGCTREPLYDPSLLSTRHKQQCSTARASVQRTRTKRGGVDPIFGSTPLLLLLVSNSRCHRQYTDCVRR